MFKSNNIPRELICFADLSQKHRDELDYFVYDNDVAFEPRFFIYRGSVYDTREFEYYGEGDYNIDGVQGQSYFSAVGIRYVNDYESVVVSYLYW